MSWLTDSTELITDGWLASKYEGLGVLVSEVPSTGTSGAGFLFNDIAAQAMLSTDEVYGEILTYPSAGTFTPNENSSFSFTDAPDGEYTATYRGFLNGTSYGDYTITLTIGGGTTPFTGNINKNSFTLSAKTLSISTGNSWQGNVLKNSLNLSGKNLSVVLGNSWSEVVLKNSLGLSYKTLSLQEVNPLILEIPLTTLTLTYKQISLASDSYRVLSSNRLHVYKLTKQIFVIK